MGKRGPKPGANKGPEPEAVDFGAMLAWAEENGVKLPRKGPKAGAINEARKAVGLGPFDLRAMPEEHARIAEAALQAVAIHPNDFPAQKQALADAVRGDAALVWALLVPYMERALYNAIGKAVAEETSIGRRESTSGPGSRPYRKRDYEAPAGTADGEPTRATRPRYPSDDRVRHRVYPGRTDP